MKSTVNVLKFRTLISVCFQIEYWFSGQEIHKFLVRVANREDHDQTASLEAV